tara:strand:- start:184 stop:3507 length:3324 start_codon:yes stop_codon:yes gene_type:complete
MSALNRSMFKKQIVNREIGSPKEGEDSSGSIGQALMQSMKNLITDGLIMNDTEMLDESKNLVDQGRDHVLNEFEFSLLYPGVSFDSVTIEERTIGANSEDMNTLIEKEAQLREQQPETMDPNSVVREGETQFRQMGSPPQGEIIEEQVDTENVGIMDGFNGGEEETAAAILQEGERSKNEIDDADTYDELMRSIRGDDLSEAERRQELASVVGEKDAEETPDSVLALVQPVLQMLNEDTANTGIGQIEEGQAMANVMPTQAGETDAMAMMMPERPVGVADGGYMSNFPNQNTAAPSITASDNIDNRIMQNLQFERMAPGMMGYAEGGLVQPYALGGDVHPIPKYKSGTSSVGVTINDATANNSLLDNTLLDDEVVEEVEPYDTTTTDFLAQILSPEPGQSALKTKYDTNYKLFSEILGGQGPSKDEKIGEILTSVVSPLAFQYAQGADIQEVLAAGTQAIGKISQKYSAAERKSESEIKSAALAQALKPAPDDPLVAVYLKDDPSTLDVDESISQIQITTSQLKADALRPIGEKLYTNNSTAMALAELAKTQGETDKTSTEKALLDKDLYYADEFLKLKMNEKKQLIKSLKINNKIDKAIAANKPEELAAALKSVDLDNVAKSITNDTLRPKLVLELEEISVGIDTQYQDLKRKIIENEFAAELKSLDVAEKAALVNEKLQTYDFNEHNNVLLLEEKREEIDNLILTGLGLDLDNKATGMTNEILRPKLIIELETMSTDLDIKLQGLKIETIKANFTEAEKLLGLEEQQGIINERLQTIDFNKNNNILLLEEKNAQIDNLILTGKNLGLENEYKVLQNKYAEEEFSETNQALLLDNINKRLTNAALSIENEYLPTEKRLSIDKIKLDMENINETISGKMLQNETTLLDLNNYDEKTFLEFQKQRGEIEKLEYELANPKKDWSQIKVQAEMRNKWNLSPMTVNMRDKQGFMENLVSNAGENTGAGDLSFIFQYMKMLDPRSVVREGEFETAKKTGGLPASVWAAYEGIKNGRLLSAQVKADFLSAASKMYMQEISNYNAELGTYRDIATSNGLNSELAIPSMNLNQELIKQLTNVNIINDSIDIIENFNLEDSILPNVSDGKLKIKIE